MSPLRHHGTTGQVALPTRQALDRLVVMVIDGVRWKDVLGEPWLRGHSSEVRARYPLGQASLLPHMMQMATERGYLAGGDRSVFTISSQSTISLPSYAELFAGRPPSCGDNQCPAADGATFLDAWLTHSPGSSLGIVCSWPAIPRVAALNIDALFVSAGRSHNGKFQGWLGDRRARDIFRQGAASLPSPGVDDYRPDWHTASLALHVLETHAPSFLFVGLGDTDELAHQNNYMGYLDALHHADAVAGQIDTWLRKREALGDRTLFVVTTDHGRSEGFVGHGGRPEASRIWALLAGSVVRTRGQPAQPDTKLLDLAPTFRSLLGIAPDTERNAGRDLTALLDLVPEPPAFDVAPELAFGALSAPETP